LFSEQILGAVFSPNLLESLDDSDATPDFIIPIFSEEFDDLIFSTRSRPQVVPFERTAVLSKREEKV
jgi:hypothetical protein